MSKIPFSTLAKRNRVLHLKKVGHPTLLSEEEERVAVEGIVTMAEWGFPVDGRTLGIIVRNFFREIKSDVFKGKLADWRTQRSAIHNIKIWLV